LQERPIILRSLILRSVLFEATAYLDENVTKSLLISPSGGRYRGFGGRDLPIQGFERKRPAFLWDTHIAYKRDIHIDKRDIHIDKRDIHIDKRQEKGTKSLLISPSGGRYRGFEGRDLPFSETITNRLQKRHTNRQKRHTHRQKRHTNRQKRHTNREKDIRIERDLSVWRKRPALLWDTHTLTTKETYTSTKETYTSTKETYTSTKETYESKETFLFQNQIRARETYNPTITEAYKPTTKETNKSTKETNTSTKQTNKSEAKSRNVPVSEIHLRQEESEDLLYSYMKTDLHTRHTNLFI